MIPAIQSRLAATLFACVATTAPALAATLDCPLRDAGYSVDAPLVDVLLKPQAKAELAKAMPELGQGMTSVLLQTSAPTFAAIVTARSVADLQHTSPATLARLDARLRALKTEAIDRIARCARYDADVPGFSLPPGRPRLLLFEKINGFRDDPSVQAARAALVAIAKARGWSIVATDKAGVMTPASLARFGAVIWNNVSGDVLTVEQRRAFRAYIERGGGFVGIHGSAGDPEYFWDWYADTLVGARFIGHPLDPQFQRAHIHIERDHSRIGDGLPTDFTMTDEWYSFRASPRRTGAQIIATLDEASYNPTGMAGKDLRMGDHPVAWTRCVGRGRAFYSAIGHRPETYTEPYYRRMLENALVFAAIHSPNECSSGKAR